MVSLSQTQINNFRVSRIAFDTWFDTNAPIGARDDWWIRLVAALYTESGCLIYAHTGEWGSGGFINEAQKAVLRTSQNFPHDALGSNGGSVGALQQIPTPVAQLATDQFTGNSRAWDGWGTIEDCMNLNTSIPKFLAQLRVTNSNNYKGKIVSNPIVADLLNVQQPLASEVASNYGASIVNTARDIASQFPQTNTIDPNDILIWISTNIE